MGCTMMRRERASVRSFPLVQAYTIRLKVTDDDGNYATGTGTVNSTAATSSVSVVSGWNLVSFNVHPSNTAMPTVLSSVSGNYTLVYAWNASSGSWLKYDTSAPSYANTLTALDETMGFWIDMNSSGTLTVTGTLPNTGGSAGASALSLSSGWNLVGFPSSSSLTLPNAFGANGVGPDFSLVYDYPSAAWKKFDLAAPSYSNSLTGLTPLYGYWVKLGVAHTWNVNY